MLAFDKARIIITKMNPRQKENFERHGQPYNYIKRCVKCNKVYGSDNRKDKEDVCLECAPKKIKRAYSLDKIMAKRGILSNLAVREQSNELLH